MTNFCFCSVFFQKMPTYAFSYTIKQHNESFLNSWGGNITQLKKTLTSQKKVSKIAKIVKKARNRHIFWTISGHVESMQWH